MELFQDPIDGVDNAGSRSPRGVPPGGFSF
jgi:hypothetical protein